MTCRSGPKPDAECECGDVYDEHERGGPCTVEGCGCVHFEEADNG